MPSSEAGCWTGRGQGPGPSNIWQSCQEGNPGGGRNTRCAAPQQPLEVFEVLPVSLPASWPLQTLPTQEPRGGWKSLVREGFLATYLPAKLPVTRGVTSDDLSRVPQSSTWPSGLPGPSVQHQSPRRPSPGQVCVFRDEGGSSHKHPGSERGVGSLWLGLWWLGRKATVGGLGAMSHEPCTQGTQTQVCWDHVGSAT